MKIIDCEQGSEAWHQARLGIPTASMFKDLITSQGKKSASFGKAVDQLVAEILMGNPAESFSTPWMERGVELESQARAFYEFNRDVSVEQVGLCLLDDGKAGASPDGLIHDRGLEVKVPAPHTHVSYLRAGKCPATYYPQVQGCMWICERDQWDFLSFHPDMPPLLITVKRDDKFIATLASLIAEMSEKVSATVESIRSKAA